MLGKTRDGKLEAWAMGNTGHLGNEVHLHETIILVPLHLIQNMLSAQ